LTPSSPDIAPPFSAPSVPPAPGSPSIRPSPTSAVLVFPEHRFRAVADVAAAAL
jgi:hypothetical protein